jgi:hypothetical protein
MYRTDDVKGFTYVLLDSIDLPPNAIANKVNIKTKFVHTSANRSFIEVYNVVFDKKQLLYSRLCRHFSVKHPPGRK